MTYSWIKVRTPANMEHRWHPVQEQLLLHLRQCSGNTGLQVPLSGKMGSLVLPPAAVRQAGLW